MLPDASRWANISLDRWYNIGYTADMKTAISIPDPIFKEAEKTAKRLGLSRSELYARAVAEFVQILKRDGITSQLDKIYAEEESALDSSLAKIQSASVFRENW